MSDQIKIVIADESAFFRSIEKQFLQNTPADIIEATDSDALLSLLEETVPALIYLSSSLLPLDGIDCCLAIKSDERFSGIPIVLICDQGRADQEERCRKAPCDEILVKPLDRHKFLQAGRRFLDVIREHRRSCLIQVDIVCKGEELRGKGLDINSGGMFIDCKSDIEVGDLVELEFKLPGPVGTLPVKCKALTTWINQRPEPLKPHYPSGFGVKFIGLSADLATMLTKIAKKFRE